MPEIPFSGRKICRAPTKPLFFFASSCLVKTLACQVSEVSGRMQQSSMGLPETPSPELEMRDAISGGAEDD